MKDVLWVGAGGALGSVLRYLTSVFASRYFPGFFPWGTFAVNILGCLAVGILLGFFAEKQTANVSLKLLLIPGFCGGYTTFSAFAAENVSLLQSGNPWIAAVYTISSIALGLLAVWVGMNVFR